MNGLLALAFSAGMLAPVNPCGFAVLPAFLAYVVGAPSDSGSGRNQILPRLVGGLRAGAALTVGFAGTFTVIGLLLAVGMRSLISVVPWLAVLLGALLAGAGLVMLAGWSPTLRLPTRHSSTAQRGSLSMAAFGAGYALASASCTAAILLAVVTQALASTNVSGVLLVFAAYAAGSATLLLSLAIFAAFSSSLISRYLRRLLPHMNRITGAILAVSGAYLLVYWLPQLVGGRPSTNVLTGVVGSVSLWINGHQLTVASTAIVLVLAVVGASLITRSAAIEPSKEQRRPKESVDDCCPPTDQRPDAGAAHEVGGLGYEHESSSPAEPGL